MEVYILIFVLIGQGYRNKRSSPSHIKPTFSITTQRVSTSDQSQDAELNQEYLCPNPMRGLSVAG